MFSFSPRDAVVELVLVTHVVDAITFWAQVTVHLSVEISEITRSVSSPPVKSNVLCSVYTCECVCV